MLVLSLLSAILWTGDYETGDISQWDGYEGIASRLTVVQSPARQGKYALRVELHQGDVAFSGTRNEVSMEGDYNVEGDDRWYAWSTMFPADFPAPNTWQVFTQWHHTGCCGSPPLEFDVEGATLQINHNGDTTLWSAPLVRGVWHDFVIHVYFSATNGYIEFWYDGVQALAKTPVATLNPGESGYLKQGLYRDASIAPVAVLYHDGMVVGTTLADVAPNLVAPPPSPPPDAGVPPSPDAGVTPPPDAGVTPPPPDAGTVVVGPPDAGPVGSEPDAGVGVTTSSLPGLTGGCSTTAAGTLAFLGLLAVLLKRRQVRR